MLYNYMGSSSPKMYGGGTNIGSSVPLDAMPITMPTGAFPIGKYNVNVDFMDHQPATYQVIGPSPTTGSQGAKVSGAAARSSNQKAPFAFPQIQGLLQAPPPQVLVIERMHSGNFLS